MVVRPALHLLLLLSLTVSSSSEGITHEEVPPPPRGCGSGVARPYWVLCDLESAWGVVLEALACGGAVSSLGLAAVLLARLKMVTEAGGRSGVGPLLLLLLGTASLFGLSLAFVVGRGEALCVARRALWGALFALCFSCLLVQAVRLRRLVAGGRGPAGSSLSGLALALTLVQGVINAEWLLLTVAREGHAACDYPPLDFALASGYALSLLLVATATSLGVVLCVGRGRDEASSSAGSKRRRWRCNAVWLFLCCLTSLLIWAGWLGFYLYGDAAVATAVTGWDEPALAVALVTEGWMLLLFHAIPEAHLCLRQANQRSEEAGQDYYDARKPLTSQGYHDDEAPTNTRAAYSERQAFSIEEHSTAVQAGGYHTGVIRPTLPFRSHVYQPTEMALLMNGGTIPTAPPNYTRRNLW
ncbi:G protein-coupled receptor, class C, group 5, member Bb isoform X2 [Electrophorus electricus]|nr:G protein-coupled receptor, class C, group 5, member Bb isoform X2 [Electrophorus electricus]XP_035390527.1 G protein-coupled receptor, class C, group 5, member Bb isoform X2 [Electrophorus electricus]XP_035390528.1 G protein-coupled receptor, class C, group 5, member Bb isoform X2 [Electrophorus electricus]XP_035390529.1 G protein-coupled receptor, class C, group 5, member Bb isoform X2 [Electrophorus electricus]